MMVYRLIYGADHGDARQEVGLFATRTLAERRVGMDHMTRTIPAGLVDIEPVELIGSTWDDALRAYGDDAPASDADELDAESLDRAAQALHQAFYGKDSSVRWRDLPRTGHGVRQHCLYDARAIVNAYFGRA